MKKRMLARQPGSVQRMRGNGNPDTLAALTASINRLQGMVTGLLIAQTGVFIALLGVELTLWCR